MDEEDPIGRDFKSERFEYQRIKKAPWENQ